MKLGSLLRKEFYVSPQDHQSISFICGHVGDDDFSINLDPHSKDRASTILETARIQKRTSILSDRDSIGFDALIEKLSSINKDDDIWTAVLLGNSWAGRVHYMREGSRHLYMGAVLARRQPMPYR